MDACPVDHVSVRERERAPVLSLCVRTYRTAVVRDRVGSRAPSDGGGRASRNEASRHTSVLDSNTRALRNDRSAHSAHTRTRLGPTRARSRRDGYGLSLSGSALRRPPSVDGRVEHGDRRRRPTVRQSEESVGSASSFMMTRLIAANFLGGSGFVKKSAMLSSVRTNGTVSSNDSTMSRMKKWRCATCFMRSWIMVLRVVGDVARGLAVGVQQRRRRLGSADRCR